MHGVLGSVLTTMIDIEIHSQPDDTTCGPTCLHAIYRYYGLDIPLSDVIHAVERSLSGGTLSPMLGKQALQQGFDATIYVNNLIIFDPTWFHNGHADPDILYAKLGAQMQYKRDPCLIQTSLAYQQYLQLGGQVRFQTLSVPLLKTYFEKKIPILTGLSATYLYACARERFTQDSASIYDDVRGTTCGHFVVLCGYDEQHKHFVVADPHRENPLSGDNYYTVGFQRLINAILLGVLTYDANLLLIKPKEV